MQNNLQVKSASVSDRGLSDKRPENEDSFLEINGSGIFAVADGVGGAQAGDVASQMAMEIVGEAFVNMANQGDAEDVMKTAIERANEAIFQMSNELPQLSTMATTVVALHINGNIATIGHVGDSRLYRVDSNGTLYRETQDHSVVEEEVRAGRMTPEQAANHPSRNIISRALGAEHVVEVDLKTIMFEANTTFLICSDGITRHITDDELNALLFSSQQPADICRRMKEICYDRGAEDNLTAVIVRISEAGADVPTDDFEQDTIATARPSMAAAAGFANPGATDNLNVPLTDSVQNSETQKLTTEAAPIIQPNQTSIENVQRETETAKVESNRTVVDYDDNDNKNSGLMGKLFGGLLLLVLGMLIGAAGYSLFFKPQPAPVEDVTPPIASQPQNDGQGDSIEANAFDTNIRDVDDDPAQYLKTFQIKPDSAADYYLIGRANLLLKNYPEARKNFNEAKNRLATAEPENARYLATEIALALGVINGLPIKDFEKELPPLQTDSSNTNTSTNGNVSPAQPINP